MISALIEDKPSISPFGPRDFVDEIEALGIPVHRAEQMPDRGVILVFAAPDHPVVTNLSLTDRGRTVLVPCEVDRGSDPESFRQALGFLGLVDDGAWSRWRGGMYVIDGFFGRTDIANAANLTLSAWGLHAADQVPLPEMLARFLVVADRLLSDTSDTAT